MSRTHLFSTFLALTLTAAACGGDEPADELAGESSADGADGKGDGASTFTFFTIKQDLRACSFDTPHCGGFYVSRANRRLTACGRGSSDTSCYVDSLDLTGTGLSQALAASYLGRIGAGEAVLLRGDIVPSADDRSTSLAVTEIWFGGSETGVAEGTFVKVRDNGIRCIQAPCPNLDELKLNSTLGAVVDQIDFSTSSSGEDAIERAREAMYGDDGVIVVGYRFKDGAGRGRTANQFYTKVAVEEAQPKRCGGFIPRFCDEGEYCDYDANSCGANDRTGICRPIPDACAQIIAPVCGCDGVTYDNACEASLHGFDVAREGACE